MARWRPTRVNSFNKCLRLVTTIDCQWQKPSYFTAASTAAMLLLFRMTQSNQSLNERYDTGNRDPPVAVFSLRSRQHSIGYIWETVFTGQKTQPTVSKYWRKNQTTQRTKYTYAHTIIDKKVQIYIAEPPSPGRRYKFHIGQQFQVQVCSMSLIIIHQFVRYDRPTFYFQYHIQYCNDSSIYVTLIYYSENKCINV